MPKILQNVEEKLIEETRRQINENGYAETSIRSIAKACGIASGTVYNYYESKDMLIATFMAEDWKELLDRATEKCEGLDDPVAAVDIIYDELVSYKKQHEKLFTDPQANVGYTLSFKTRHGQMIKQLVDIIGPVCSRKAPGDAAPTAEFIAETLILWTMQERDYAGYRTLIGRMF